MATVSYQAYAKVNLGLDVTGKREDGYHDVSMVMQTIRLSDTVRVSRLEEDVIRITSNDATLPCDERNLVYRAAALIKQEFGIQQGLNVYIGKKIPVAAGMAGGSADCAACLKACNLLFKLHLSQEALMAYGLRLGADVPYCIVGGTALAQGIGEKITVLPPLPDCHILIAKPPIAVSTGKVYQAFDGEGSVVHPDICGMVKAIANDNLEGVTSRMMNVLAPVTEKMHPEIVVLKDIMRTAGAKNAMMTGSGPTVFGIFEEETLAEDAKNEIIKSGLAKEVFLVKPITMID